MRLDPTEPPECSKRGFPSKDAAKRANARVPWRLRAYRCPECRKWHITNAEKRWNWNA